MSTDSNEVPVSVVDMDVPVTAIDEVLVDYERITVQHEAMTLIKTKSAIGKGRKNRLKSVVCFWVFFCMYIELIFLSPSYHSSRLFSQVQYRATEQEQQCLYSCCQ